MINSFVESTVWKRTATFGAHYLLRLVCCLIMLLGGVLVVGNLQAQSFRKGDKVVAQNTLYGLEVHIDGPNSGKDGEISAGTRGTIEEGPEEVDGIVWYKVSWEFPQIGGWSRATIDGCKVIGTVEEAARRDDIVAKLFKIPWQDVDSSTFHEYNGYKCSASWKRTNKEGKRVLVYAGGGGHSGWDVQTQDKSPNRTFFSLTAGQLTMPDEKGMTDSHNTIAVFDGQMTTLYLHASEVLVTPDNKGMVHVGQPLGKQGKTGPLTDAVHVHIEVQVGKSSTPSTSAGVRPPYRADGVKPTVDPIPYLYKWVIGARTENPLDVNHNGWVEPLDAIDVFLNWGTDNLQYDVNGDGIVDPADFPGARLHSAQNTPERKIHLLTNYPNPFNPETWIPYQLAWSADVSISIHAADGTEVRTLDLGHRPAGLYLQRSRAVYWDGRNEFGEEVASGIYFYTMSAGNFTTTRRMLIRR